MPSDKHEPAPDATGAFTPDGDDANQPDKAAAVGEATGDFTPPAPVKPVKPAPLPKAAVKIVKPVPFRRPAAPEQPVGEATGAYVADLDDPGSSGQARGDATGAWVGEATDERQGGATRGGPVAPVGEATGDFTAQPPGGAETGNPVSDMTGAFVSEDMPAAPNRTGLRSLARMTSAGSAGAFPVNEPTQKTGRYFLQKFHAKGGMGEIWLAEDGDIGRKVALKRMLKGREDQRNQFLLEAQVTGQLEHPGVVPIHELGVDENDQPFYTMKFVHGKTLQEVIKEYHAVLKGENKAPAKEPPEVMQLRLLNIFLNLCQTVAYAHSRGVIHRDLKPDNVMVGPFGETLVLDWGLAKVVGRPDEAAEDPAGEIKLSAYDDSMATLDGSIKGTPAYFAPEVAEGKVSEVDQLSDIYLLGGILYAILTGRAPRHANKIKELLSMARHKTPDPPRQLKPDIPKPLNAICVKAIAHAKKDRYQTASALAEDMQRYLAGEPVSSYQESFFERAGRWIRKHKTLLTRSAAALLIVALGAVAFSMYRGRQEAERVATKLKNEDTARIQIKSFRDLSEEARFYVAMADPMTENSPFVDLAKAEGKAKEALAVADPWGGADLAELPLEDQRPELKTELYNLLVELAQVKTLTPGADSARDALALLERAESLHTPTRSLYRLRGQSLKTLGQGDKGEADAKRAQDQAVATTALDHFLQADQLRRESLLPGEAPKDEKIPDPEKKQKGAIKSLQRRTDILLAAVKEYREALAIDPDHYWSRFQLAKCYTGLGQLPEAVEAFGACIALRPKAAAAYSSRALAFVGLKLYEDAEKDLKIAADLDKDSLPTRLQRGSVFFQEGKYKEALADVNAVLEAPADKRLLEAAYTRGQLLMFNKEHDKALADFDLVVEKNLKYRHVYLWRARVYFLQARTEQALENVGLFLTNGQKPDPKDAKLAEQIGREIRILVNELPFDDTVGKRAAYRALVSQLENAIKLGASSPGLYFELGAAQELLAQTAGNDREEMVQRYKNALAAYAKGLEIDPKHVRLHIKRGWTFVDVDQNDEAQKDFDAAVQVDAKNPEAQVGLGYTLAVAKDAVGARRHANLAVLNAAGRYLILHNVAAVFATLSEQDAGRKREYQDLALDQLEQAVHLWKLTERQGPNELNYMRNESAFSKEFQNRPEFRKLLNTKD